MLIESLGGAVSAHIAANNLLPLLCLCVIDVVEGSAMDALQSMQTYLSSRPRIFRSMEQGIQWHLHSRTIRNRESARVSVPALLIQDHGQYKWRTDLAKTRPFWEGTRAPSVMLIQIGSKDCQGNFWLVERGNYFCSPERIDLINR
jgi:hypothetical protein